MLRSFQPRWFDLIFILMGGAMVWLTLSATRDDLGSYEPSLYGEDSDIQPLGWRDLRLLDVRSGKADPRLQKFDGQLVRVPGYIVPLEDYQARTAQFLLVPYVGACIHLPPPPPNQIVMVEMVNGPVAFEMWEAYWISGRLFIEDAESPYGPVGFVMQGLEIAPFEGAE